MFWILMGCLAPQMAGLEADNAALRAELEAQQAQIEVLDARLTQHEDEDPMKQLNALMEQQMALLEAPSPSPPPTALTVRMEDGVAVVSKTELLGAAEDPTRLGRIIPHRGADGEYDGFRVSAIRRGSALDAIGLRNGDVVHSVNGQSVKSPDEALQLYVELKDVDELTIAVTRRGKPVEIRVRVEDS